MHTAAACRRVSVPQQRVHQIQSESSAETVLYEVAELALHHLRSVLDGFTSPDGVLFGRLLRVLTDPEVREPVVIDPAPLVDALAGRLEPVLRSRLGSCPAGLFSDLTVPPMAVQMAGVTSAVREVTRTASVASLAAVAADLTVSTAVGQAAGSPLADVAADILGIAPELLRRMGADPEVERHRADREIRRRLQGVLINLRTELYNVLAPQVVEAICSAYAPEPWASSRAHWAGTAPDAESMPLGA